MALHLLLLFAGILLLLGGGDLLVRGASALAKGFGIPSFVIGLTIVSFGTSAPELAINLLASFQGNPGISFGNIIGSNIANIGLILGISAIIRPLAIQGTIITREIPIMVLCAVLALIAGMDAVFRDAPNAFDRREGLVFLLMFFVFLLYMGRSLVRGRPEDPLLKQAGERSGGKSFGKTAFNLLLFIAGLILLLIGGKLAVDAAVAVAQVFNVPQVIIGLTIVAVGTSLPELVTSCVAVWKGETDIAIGNIVGSNIFNLLLVTGLTASLRPIPIPPSGGQDLLMMVFLSILLLPLCITHKKRILRWEGGVLVILYFAFNSWRIYMG